jgi:ferredoxin
MKMLKIIAFIMAVVLMFGLLIAEEATDSKETVKEMLTFSGKLDQKEKQWLIIAEKPILLELAPEAFLNEQGLKLKKKIDVEVVGIFAQNIFLVHSISMKEKTYQLRDQAGAPLWQTKKPTNPHYVVDASKCIGCRLCVNICPVNAIEFKNGKAIIDAEKCINCGICKNGNRSNYKGCPVGAIDSDKTE